MNGRGARVKRSRVAISKNCGMAAGHFCCWHIKTPYPPARSAWQVQFVLPVNTFWAAPDFQKLLSLSVCPFCSRDICAAAYTMVRLRQAVAHSIAAVVPANGLVSNCCLVCRSALFLQTGEAICAAQNDVQIQRCQGFAAL